MTEEWDKLKERIAGLSTEELLNMVGVEYKDYRPEALQFAMGELDRRGVQYRSPLKSATLPYSNDGLAADDEEEDEDEEGSDDKPAPPICKECGAEARLAYLFTDRELTVLFADNSEERFVEVHACKKCGHVSLEIDYETEVESGEIV